VLLGPLRSQPAFQAFVRALRGLPYLGRYVEAAIARVKSIEAPREPAQAPLAQPWRAPADTADPHTAIKFGGVPPIPVAILGYDETTNDLLKLTALCGLRPVAIHTLPGGLRDGSAIDISREEINAATQGRANVDGPLHVPVLDREAFAKLANENNIPVLIGSYAVRERDLFRDAFFYGRGVVKLKGPIIHPAVFADHYRSPHRRFQLIAFPGSGNTVVQAVFSQLTEAGLPAYTAPDDLASRQISQYCYHYYFSLYNLVSSLFDLHGRWRADGAPSHTRYGGVYVPIGGERNKVSVSGLPQRAYTWAQRWNGSHEPLTAKAIQFFAEQNFQIIQILRHPLDLIVTNAAKITSLSGNREPSLLIQNEEWMTSMLDVLEGYFKGISEHHTEVDCVKYEDLLADPARTIRQLANIIDADVSDETIAGIWNGVKGRILSGDAGHYWNPSAGKWMQYIPARYADRIMASPLREYAARLGYRIEREMFKGDAVFTPSGRCSELDLAWQDARWEAPTGKQPGLRHPDLYRVHDAGLGLLFIGSMRYKDEMERLRHSPIFADLLAAGRAPANAEPSLIAEHIGLR